MANNNSNNGKKGKELVPYFDHWYDHEVTDKKTGTKKQVSDEVWGLVDPETGVRYKAYQDKYGRYHRTTKLGNNYHAEIRMNEKRHQGLLNAGIPEEDITSVKHRDASSMKGIKEEAAKAGHAGDTVIITKGSKHRSTMVFPERTYEGKIGCSPDDDGVFKRENNYTYVDFKGGQTVEKGQRKPHNRRHYVTYSKGGKD